MGAVGVEIFILGFLSNKVYDFVFALSRYITSTVNDGELLPMIVFIEFFHYEEFHLLIQLVHEFCACTNGVVFEDFNLRLFAEHVESFVQLLKAFSRSKSPRSLLIHFGAGSRTVERQENKLSWSHQINYLVYVVENISVKLHEILFLN